MPWDKIAVDLIGPWGIDVPNIGELKFKALTIIDTCTMLCEVIQIENKSANHIVQKLEQSWLARYPRPSKCVHNQGPEFKAAAFQLYLASLRVKPTLTTVKNPQSNAICERMHKMVKDMLHVYLLDNPPQDVGTAIEIVNTVLVAVQKALRTYVHQALGILPRALVFHRDMLLPLPIQADFNLI